MSRSGDEGVDPPAEQGEDPSTVSLAAALRCFEGRRPVVHLVALVGALALWGVLFLLVFRFGLVATDPMAVGAEARAGRRLAGGLAGAGTGAALGVLTMRRFGGPFLNFLLAPLSSVIAPTIVFPLVFGGFTTLYAPAADRLAPESLVATLPGAVTFLLAAGLYVELAWSEADAQRWRDALPPNPIIQPVEDE